MNTTFALKIEEPTLDPYSKRQYGADVYCTCCGRGISMRETATVVILGGFNKETGETLFSKIPWNEVKGRDSVEWGVFVGSHCAKQLPKEYKVSQRRVLTAWNKVGCP